MFFFFTFFCFIQTICTKERTIYFCNNEKCEKKILQAIIIHKQFCQFRFTLIFSISLSPSQGMRDSEMSNWMSVMLSTNSFFWQMKKKKNVITVAFQFFLFIPALHKMAFQIFFFFLSRSFDTCPFPYNSRGKKNLQEK